MLEYILNIIRQSNFKSPLHNAFYNILNDYQYRRHISYNANSDRFEIACSEINPTLSWLFEKNGYGTTQKVLTGTNIYIEVWADTLSFWLE